MPPFVAFVVKTFVRSASCYFLFRNFPGMTLQWFGLLGAIRSSQRALSLLRHREYSPLTPVSLRTLSPFPASLRAKRSNLFSLSCVIASVTKRSFFPVVCHCERSDAIFFSSPASSRAILSSFMRHRERSDAIFYYQGTI